MSGPREPAQHEHGPLPFDLPRVTDAQRRRAAELLAALELHYPDAHCELDYRNPHELLVATILSAQATDVGVNKATPALFAAFPTPADYAASTPAQIESYIRSIGLFRNKARSIHAAMKDIVEKFGGRVPRTMEELLMRGVARKTANVVLGNAFGINVGFVVDTHVERLARQLRSGAGRCVGGDDRAAADGLVPATAGAMFRTCSSGTAEEPARPDCPLARTTAFAAFGAKCELRISARTT